MSGGVCLDALNPSGRPAPSELLALGCSLVRMQARFDEQMYRYHDDCRRAGFQTAVVLDRDAYPNIEEHALTIAPTYWVIGNEMDAYLLPEPSPSSWSMTPDEYVILFTSTRRTILKRQPEALLIIGGLVSGQAWWLDECGDLGAAGIDVHPYSKSASEAEQLIVEYESLYGLPIYVLEWHRDAPEISSYQRMLDVWTAGSAYFAWHDVDGLGLHDSDGNQKPEYHAFKAALEGVPTMTAIDEREAQLAAAGKDLGQALAEEAVIEMRVKPFYNALLLDVGAAGVYCVAEATVADKFLDRPGR